MRNFLIPFLAGWSVPAIARLLGLFGPGKNTTVDHILRLVDIIVLGFIFGSLSYLAVARLVRWWLQRRTPTELLRAEVRDAWGKARTARGETEAFRIMERMVDRVGYGRTENNPRNY